MRIAEFTFEENEDSQSGWTGTLTFTETKNFGAGKAEDNSSTPVNTAAAAPAAVVSAAMKSLPESLRRLLEKAGIR